MKKKVIMTIDTEGHAGTDPIRRLIMGETPSGEMGGIPLLMDIFDEFHVKGLFFLDFAEAFYEAPWRPLIYPDINL